MKPLNKPEDLSKQIEIFQLKKKIGAFYGMAAGFAFAAASWGWDGYILNASHGYYPWTMLVIGLTFCVIFGGIIGWLTARSESSLFGVVLWVTASAGFAWLMVALPLQINPALVSKFDPRLGALLNYKEGGEFIYRFCVSLLWILPFMLVVGVTQLPISESAVFSTSIFGKFAPLFFCVLVMGVSGTFTDNLINAHFRDAIVSLDTTIQFVLDNKDNKNVNLARSRELHTGALRKVEEYVRGKRHLFVGSYDGYFGSLHVLVKFDNQWVDCQVLYNQPVSCEPAADN
jgi:hypothetical protein